jgi:hypothetical protein
MRRAIGVVDRSDLCRKLACYIFACELIIIILTNQGKTENSQKLHFKLRKLIELSVELQIIAIAE